jgi:nitrous oxidase accessory protein NosD
MTRRLLRVAIRRARRAVEVSFQKVSRRALLYGTPAAAGAAILVGDVAAAATVGSTASPRDYGAAGDGVTDDTSAINTCLAQNRAVDFGGPDSSYLITGTVLVQQSVAQVLTGRGATIKAGAAVTMARLKNAGHTVSGLVFDGNNQASGLGLIIEGTAPSSLVEGCTFVDVAASGIHLQAGAHHTKIVGCTLDHCGHGSGVASPYNSTLFVADADFCTVLDNEMLACDWGIYFRGSTSATGINLYNCRGNTLTCANPAPVSSQGISNGYGRGGRIQNNSIVGFADNGIDCFGCADMTIVGNTTRGGKDGVFVGDAASRSITITGNVFSGPQRGVRVHSDTAGALITGVVISGNSVSYPTDGGILVNEAGTAQVTGISITDNDLHIGDAGSYGVKMVNAEVSKVGGNRIFRSRSEAIYLNGVDIVELIENTLQDAGHPAPNTYNAIQVTNSNRVVMRGNIVYGSARYAVEITGGTGMTVTGTRWRSVGTGGVNNGATNTVLSDNLQF